LGKLVLKKEKRAPSFDGLHEVKEIISKKGISNLEGKQENNV
jgi:hypothetical protein